MKLVKLWESQNTCVLQFVPMQYNKTDIKTGALRAAYLTRQMTSKLQLSETIWFANWREARVKTAEISCRTTYIGSTYTAQKENCLQLFFLSPLWVYMARTEIAVQKPEVHYEHEMEK